MLDSGREQHRQQPLPSRRFVLEAGQGGTDGEQDKLLMLDGDARCGGNTSAKRGESCGTVFETRQPGKGVWHHRELRVRPALCSGDYSPRWEKRATNQTEKQGGMKCLERQRQRRLVWSAKAKHDVNKQSTRGGVSG